MEDLIKTEDGKFARDPNSGGILNFDENARRIYREKLEKKKLIEKLVEDVSNIKKDIEKVKKRLNAINTNTDNR